MALADEMRAAETQKKRMKKKRKKNKQTADEAPPPSESPHGAFRERAATAGHAADGLEDPLSAGRARVDSDCDELTAIRRPATTTSLCETQIRL